MVAVFKTNVNDKAHAQLLLDHIHTTFANLQATFDLEDCDKILRVKSSAPTLPCELTDLLQKHNCCASLLTD